MVWLMSLALCALLIAGILLISFPELFPAFIADRWKRNFHFYRH